jgi:hypothetical protein
MEERARQNRAQMTENVEVLVIVVPHQAPPARRWLAQFVHASEAAEAPVDLSADTASFDPDAVLALAFHEGVAPLLHLGCINGRIQVPLPDSFRGACEAAYYRNLRRNIRTLKSGKRILDALRAASISAAPTDGWAVMGGPFRYYEDSGSRQLESLELMVRESDRERAESVLADIGFQRVAEARDSELSFRNDDADPDLHLDLRWGWQASVGSNEPLSISGDQFLDRLCDTTVLGFHRPARITNLVVASIRAATHTMGRWIWLGDIHRVITAVPMNWEELVTTAQRWRVRAPVYASLVATRELMGTPIPREVLRRLSPGPVRRRLLHRSLAASQGKGSGCNAARAARLLLGENWWEVARAAARNAAPRHARAQAWGGASPALVRLSQSMHVASPVADNS